MTAIDVIRHALRRCGVAEPPSPKERKPDVIAMADVHACTACGLCVPHCPEQCIEALPEGTVPGRDPQPVQVRPAECTGCQICVEICSQIARADALRVYETNLIEQVLGTEITAEPEPAGFPPEPGDEYWADGGGFHHMGEGSRIADHLTPEESSLLDEAGHRGATAS